MTTTTDSTKTGISPVSMVSVPVVEVIGTAIPVTGNGAVASGYTFWDNLPAKADGTVTQFQAFFSSTGTILFRTLRDNGDGTFDVVASSSAVIAATGLQTVPLSMGIPKGGFLAFNSASSAIPKYTTTASGYPYYYKTTDIAGSAQTASGQTTGQRLEYNYTVSYTDASHVAAAQIDLAVSAAAASGACPLESVKGFTYQPSNWVAGTWTFGGGKASSGAVGRANQMRSPNQYGIDRRTIRWEFAITTAATTFEFLTNPIEGGISSGSIIRIDGAGGTLDVYGRYDGSNSPVSVTSQAMGFTLATGSRYICEWTKADRAFTVQIWNAAKAATENFSYTRAATPLGYSTYPSYGYDQGNMHGSPGVAVIAGSMDVWQYDHYATSVTRPHLYVLGDSITEGFTVPDALTLATRLRAEFGATRVACSGIGGAVTAAALTRMQQELAYMRPRWVLVFLGTNSDASFATNIQTIVTYAQALGCKVIVATIPTDAGRTATVNALASTVYKTYWDLELTATGAGSALTAAFYANTDASAASYNDSLHPNALGDLHRFNRLLRDVPQLLA
jgi:hypothetical protein